MEHFLSGVRWMFSLRKLTQDPISWAEAYEEMRAALPDHEGQVLIGELRYLERLGEDLLPEFEKQAARLDSRRSQQT
jgi:hypothetical protein